MTEMTPAPSLFIRVGVLINSALYLTGCFVAGLLFNQPIAWKAALLTAAIAYLAYVAQDLGRIKVAMPLVLLSVVTGAVSGIALLFI